MRREGRCQSQRMKRRGLYGCEEVDGKRGGGQHVAQREWDRGSICWRDGCDKAHIEEVGLLGPASFGLYYSFRNPSCDVILMKTGWTIPFIKLILKWTMRCRERCISWVSFRLHSKISRKMILRFARIKKIARCRNLSNHSIHILTSNTFVTLISCSRHEIPSIFNLSVRWNYHWYKNKGGLSLNIPQCCKLRKKASLLPITTVNIFLSDYEFKFHWLYKIY